LLGLPLARAAEPHLFGSEPAAAPDLLNAEVLHVLRHYERRGAIDAGWSRQALEDLVDLPIVRYPTLALLEGAWTLRRNLTGYDAMYALGAPLVTSDSRLAAAARQHAGVSVVLLSR
jgi:predicted nucleic acid-binding protein